MGKYDAWRPLFRDLAESREHRIPLEVLNDAVGDSLPASALREAAWWSNTWYYSRVWTDYGWYARPRLCDGVILFTRTKPSRGRPPESLRSETRQAPSTLARDPESDLILLGCVSEKRPHPAPAKNLYMSSLWERRRAYAEASKKPWRILSAQHGVIDPDELIAPYDVALKDLSAGERRAWARRTAPQVLEVLIETGAETVEIHAGAAYTESGLRQTLEALGYRVIIPLAHHRIGEQLAWYQRRPEPLTASEPHTLRVPTADHASRLAADYRSKAFGGGWGGLPEAIGADRLRSEGVNEVGIRRWITFVAAMDRARDATRLWESSVAAFPSDAWIYDPPKVIGRPHHDLQTTLKRLSISQRHGPDCDAWRIIAETLTDPACPGTVIAALHGRPVKAADLLEALQRKRLDGAPRFPLLKGPKIGPLWVRMLVFPGGAQVSGLETIPVAVDTHVQRASEMLGLVFTRELSDGHRRNIQQVWFDAVGKTGSFGGPEAIDGTAAGLDPALWALGREGCSRCEQARVMKPIGSICDLCVLGRVG